MRRSSPPPCLLPWMAPPLFGWRSYPRASTNLLIFGLVMVAGEWIVHQTSYLIEYGSSFDAVMAGTPHRLYMGQIGVGLFVTLALLSLMICCVVAAQRFRLKQLLDVLPSRLRSVVEHDLGRISPRGVAKTWILLAGCQVALFTIQENLEALAQLGRAPGLSILVGSGHASVIPLHLLVSLCCAVILRTLVALLSRSSRATRLAQLLVELFGCRPAVARVAAPSWDDRCRARPMTGSRSLRSPPLAA